MLDKINKAREDLEGRVGLLSTQMDDMQGTTKLTSQIGDRLGRMELKF
jgi:hypothetical protein